MKKKAIIVDLDGTLCNTKHRNHILETNPGNWDKFNEGIPFDIPNPWCMEIVENFAKEGYHILFVTGRNSNTHDATEQWLRTYLNPTVQWDLHMRPDHNYIADTIIKTNIYFTKILPFYDVVFCVDDKRSICDLWRSLGLVALHCEDY